MAMAGGVQIMLKSLGISISDENIKMVETLVPQLPAKIQEAVTVINASLKNFDARLAVLESQTALINSKLDAIMEFCGISKEP